MQVIHRRQWLIVGAASGLAHRLPAAWALGADVQAGFQRASDILQAAVRSGQMQAAAIYARDANTEFSRAFGSAPSVDAAFLLGSISKPICMAALMTLYDQGRFQLHDPVQKYLPEFRGDRRGQVTISHLLTHVSGLPDQLPNNAELRASHAPLGEFVQAAMQVPLGFEPGSRYEYSSMGILLAAEIAQRLADEDIRELVWERVLQPLAMQHSDLGVQRLKPALIMPAQVEFGARESGGGSAQSRSWDWNSDYWRQLGAPWGGAHASAPAVARFLTAFLQPPEGFLRPQTAELMIANHNPEGIESRGLGFDVGMQAHCAHATPTTFGHTGSTGTIAWADPASGRLCVVLTTLPAGALEATTHPRRLAADAVFENQPDN